MEAPMQIKGKSYKCTEQYYFSRKAEVYGDDEAYRDIMKSSDPAQMLRIGRRAKNMNNVNWKEMDVAIMKEANQNKYDQNEEARQFLLGTGQTRLGEASAQNKFWGTGYSLSHKDRADANRWSENKMGELLAEIRDSYPAAALVVDLPAMETEASKL